MKLYQIGEQNGLDALTMAERAAPMIGDTDLLIAPQLVALNNRDLQIINGTYGAKKASTRIPLSEGVGEVVAVGAQVTDFAVGDRVVSGHFLNWTGGAFGYHAFADDLGVSRDGWLADQMVLPAAAAVPVPATLSDEQAATLAAAGLTAWNALVEVGQVKAGDMVLCLGTGGVAMAALKIARAKGARVAITSSSDEKLAKARQLGAEITINYAENPDWAAELMAQTGGAGANIVVETGGQGTLGQSIAAAAVNGRIVIIGVTVGVGTTLDNYGTIIGKNLTLRGIANGSRAMLVDYANLVAEQNIQPEIEKIFDFAQAKEAYRHLASADHMGKVLVRIS